MPLVQAGRYRLFYECPHLLGGQTPGARLLFLHGTGVDHRLFEDQLRFFSAANTPIALDLPGHGRSEGEAQEEVSAYREAVKGFVNALHLAPIVLCGHALGGAIALDYAAHHSSDLEGLVLADMGVTFPLAPEALEEMARDPAGYRQRYARRGLSERARETAAQSLDDARGRTPVRSTLRDLAAASKWDATSRMAVVQVPTLVLFGEEDPLVAQAGSILEAMRHAFFDTIPLARHFPHLEAPDIFNDSVNSFLTIVPDLAMAGGE